MMDPHTPYSLASVMPPPPKPSRPSWVIPAVAGLAVALVAVAGVAAWALQRPAATAPKPAVPGSITIQGGLTLSAGLSIHPLGATNCDGKGGYSDIREGASVTVTDPAGATIGVSQLGPGLLLESDIGRTCAFAFTVHAVPAGKGFYGIEVSHRGRVTYAEANVTVSRNVQLEIGK